MKIALLTERFHPFIGGVESHVLGLANHLAAAGLRPVVVTNEPAAPDSAPGTPGRARIPVVRIAGPRAVSDVLKEIRPDIVHVHGGRVPLSAAGALACGRMRLPYVITPHCFYPSRSIWDRVRKSVYDRIVVRRLLCRARAVIALTQVDRKDALDHGARPHSLVVIPNSVDLEGIRGSATSVPDGWHDTGALSVCAVGRLDRIKRFDLLMQAFATEARGQDRLIIVGPDAGAGVSLRTLASALGLGDRVIFAGSVPDDQLLGLYKTAGLVVLPSAFEGLPTVVLEAMAMGAPILSSDAGGTATVIRDGDNGFLFRNGDLGHLRLTLGRIMKDGVPRRVVERAREDVRSRYSWAVNAPRLQRLYERCLQSHAPVLDSV